MKHLPSLLLLAALAPACGDGETSTPDRLYLYLLDSELSVQLVEEEPEPF